MLPRLEKLTCLLAALAALLVEASFIYCIRLYPATGMTWSWACAASWTSPTLRQTFLQLWYWFLALASTQGLALHLNYAWLVRR